MKKSQFKQLIKEVIQETESEKDFERMRDALFRDWKISRRNRPSFAEEEAYKEGFFEGYNAKGSGY